MRAKLIVKASDNSTSYLWIDTSTAGKWIPILIFFDGPFCDNHQKKEKTDHSYFLTSLTRAISRRAVPVMVVSINDVMPMRQGGTRIKE
jgi:hypothetical protein